MKQVKKELRGAVKRGIQSQGLRSTVAGKGKGGVVGHEEPNKLQPFAYYHLPSVMESLTRLGVTTACARAI